MQFCKGKGEGCGHFLQYFCWCNFFVAKIMNQLTKCVSRSKFQIYLDLMAMSPADNIDISDITNGSLTPDDGEVGVLREEVKELRRRLKNCSCDENKTVKKDNLKISIGSRLHPNQCAPCQFIHRKDGCRHEAACTYCHLCDKKEVNRRKRLNASAKIPYARYLENSKHNYAALEKEVRKHNNPMQCTPSFCNSEESPKIAPPVTLSMRSPVTLSMRSSRNTSDYRTFPPVYHQRASQGNDTKPACVLPLDTLLDDSELRRELAFRHACKDTFLTPGNDQSYGSSGEPMCHTSGGVAYLSCQPSADPLRPRVRPDVLPNGDYSI
eukprot:GEMP01077442.1.p1 GENE.GEMP01077442.1~~GEMP01077442.1.p1  ORF type:complete len:324 (+),score=56.91 GEMP01077442.1:43-1014(+)